MSNLQSLLRKQHLMHMACTCKQYYRKVYWSNYYIPQFIGLEYGFSILGMEFSHFGLEQKMSRTGSSKISIVKNK